VNRTRTILAGAALAVVIAGSASASPGQSSDPAPPGAVVELQQEIDAMRAAGLPADHPKVEMLQREVDALVAGTDATPVPDPGAGGPSAARGQAATPEQAVRLEEQIDAGDEGDDAESGTVECEPVPQALTAAEVASASSCLSVPQPDGTSRYLAVEPSGQVHVVRFGDDGHVERLPDQQLPAGATQGQVRLVPDEAGDVEVLSGGAEVGTLDPG
jgi:hypothetical protein